MNENYNKKLVEESIEGKQKINLFMGCKHSKKFGSPRRCTNKACLDSFTPHEFCPTCGTETRKLGKQ